LLQVPEDVEEVTVQTWQLFAGFKSPLRKQLPPMRQKPSSVTPSQSLSIPSQTSVVGEPAVAEQVVPVPALLQT
jgi:hypothetical protein